MREGEWMRETLAVPVLPLDDSVVLPTMVVPFDTSGAEVRAAIEAAQSATTGQPDDKPRGLLVPRLGGKYSAVGTLGVLEQLGRLPSGAPAAVIRGPAPVRAGGAGRHRDHRERWRGAHGEAGVGVPAPPAARGDPQGTRGARRQGGLRGGRLPGQDRGGGPAGEGGRGGAERGRQAGAQLGRLAGGQLDPDLAGHRA